VKPYYQDDYATIYCGDCREILPQLPRVDLVLTDPPYGLGDKLKSGDNGEWSKGFSVAPTWDASVVPSWLILQVIEKAEGSIIWGGNYYPLPPVRGWLGWDKMQEHTSGHYELAWTNLDIPTRMFRKSRVEAYGGMDKQHPTQKPEGLLTWCIEKSPKAQTILDPFMGSGTTLVAAKQLGRKAIGIEIEEKYCEIAATRLRNEPNPLFVDSTPTPCATERELW
jgi:site-specific DNA-methyltransferase (adenine-specific)